jgi:hypothetical protein
MPKLTPAGASFGLSGELPPAIEDLFYAGFMPV